MSDPYIGEIRVFSFDYAPMGWVFCDGQLLPLLQYQTLYAVIGTFYGGDGKTTVGVPNLKGRIPLNLGVGQYFSYPLASTGGYESIALNLAQIANHNHAMAATNTTVGTTNNPAGHFTGIHNEPGKGTVYKTNPTLDAQFAPQAIAATGASQAHENRQPYLPVNFCMAVEGIFPVRS